MPTTARPSRTSRAATVELSTPPLMATAMGCCSGMHGDSAQVGHGRGDRVGERVDLFGGVGPAEREAHAGAGAVGVHSDGGEDMRRGDGAGGAGRAGRYGETAQIERNDHGLAIDAVEVEVAGVRDAAPAGAVDAGAGDAVEDERLEAVAESTQARRLA